MNGTASGPSSEEPLQADRVIALIEQHVQEHAGALAINLGIELSESVDADGHFKDALGLCSRIRDWYAKRGEQGHAMLLGEYGRLLGTEIWSWRDLHAEPVTGRITAATNDDRTPRTTSRHRQAEHCSRYALISVPK